MSIPRLTSPFVWAGKKCPFPAEEVGGRGSIPRLSWIVDTNSTTAANHILACLGFQNPVKLRGPSRARWTVHAVYPSAAQNNVEIGNRLPGLAGNGEVLLPATGPIQRMAGVFSPRTRLGLRCRCVSFIHRLARHLWQRLFASFPYRVALSHWAPLHFAPSKWSLTFPRYST